MIIGGVKIFESPTALKETTTRVKTFPKRKAKTEAHWRRMDKKYRKRYGFQREPCIFKMMDPTGFGSDMFIVHPTLMPQIRAALSELNDNSFRT